MNDARNRLSKPTKKKKIKKTSTEISLFLALVFLFDGD